MTLATKASFEGWWLIGGRAPAVPSPSAPQSCPRQSRIRPHPVSIPFAFDLFFFKSFILTIRQFWECHLHFKKTQKPSPARICFSFFFLLPCSSLESLLYLRRLLPSRSPTTPAHTLPDLLEAPSGHPPSPTKSLLFCLPQKLQVTFPGQHPPGDPKILSHPKSHWNSIRNKRFFYLFIYF